MRNITRLLIMVLLLFIMFRVVAHGEGYQCSEGQYPIGDNICKNEPTGCPYGDSIPLDTPKCVAPPVLEQTPIPVTPVIDTPIVTEVWGK